MLRCTYQERPAWRAGNVAMETAHSAQPALTRKCNAMAWPFGLSGGRMRRAPVRIVVPSILGDLMIGLPRGRLASTFGLLLVPIALAGSPAYADGTPARVRGSVVSLDGST